MVGHHDWNESNIQYCLDSYIGRCSLTHPFFLNFCCVRLLQTLSEDDLDSNSNEDAPRWNIPKPGQKVTDDKPVSREQEQIRSISGDCAICYYQYTPGDRITWSSNPNCIHCYHSRCVQAWLLPWQERNRLCPCCRQSYCVEYPVDCG